MGHVCDPRAHVEREARAATMSARHPNILALDVATNTGICVGRAGETPRFSTFKSERSQAEANLTFSQKCDRHEDAWFSLFCHVAELIDADPPDWIFVEAAPNPGAFAGEFNVETGRVEQKSNPHTLLRLSGFWAALSCLTRYSEISFRRVSVQTARVSFIGKGNLKGNEAKRRAFDMCRLLGWSPHNRDEGDAGAVWYHATTVVAPKLSVPITPMMQAKVATTIGGVQIEDAESFFKKAPRARA